MRWFKERMQYGEGHGMDTEFIRLLRDVFFAITAAIEALQKVVELFYDNSEQKPPKHKKPRSSARRFTHKTS